MTDIKFLKNRIILDGHADTRQECETITLLCNNLAKSKDFKTVRYENGYAEFEKVGKANELKFAAEPAVIKMVWDSHVTSVSWVNTSSDSSETESASWTTSGEEQTLWGRSTTTGVATVVLEEGYVLNTVTWEGDGAPIGTVSSKNTFELGNFVNNVNGTATITTKQSKPTPTTHQIDVSTLSGWKDLPSGDYLITVKAVVGGYAISAGSGAVPITKVANSYNVTVTGSGNNNGFKIYDGTSTSGTLLGSVSSQNSLTVTCTSGFLYIGWGGQWYQDDAVVTGGVSVSSTEGDFVLFKVTGDGTITVGFACLIEGTQITLADGSTKAIEDITYDDELLVWNFYEGKFDIAKPKWIKIAETAPKYNLVKFSNSAEVGFVGAGGENGYHRIFNKEAGAFTHTGCKDTPNGTTTFAQDKTFSTVVSQEVVEKEVKFYNVITDKHYNLFANGILTSCRLSNKYHIEDMRYIGEENISKEEEITYLSNLESTRK